VSRRPRGATSERASRVEPTAPAQPAAAPTPTPTPAPPRERPTESRDLFLNPYRR
jgi:hypothetical protein